MTRYGPLAFKITRSDDKCSGVSMTSVTARIHGLLRNDTDPLVIQWCLARRYFSNRSWKLCGWCLF